LRSTDGWYLDPPFVMFDTQEVICTTGYLRPDLRGHYPLLDVSVYLTTDSACPKLFTPDGEAIPKAWLNQDGSQTVLVDHHTKRVVRLCRYEDKGRETMPMRFRKPYVASAYFPGNEQPPVAAPMVVRPSNKFSLSKDEREHIDTITCAVRAMLTLNPDHPAASHVKVTNKGYNGQVYTYSRRDGAELSLDRLLEVSSASELTEVEMRRLFLNGTTRRERTYPYLLTVDNSPLPLETANV
jgi:hypothetical protein